MSNMAPFGTAWRRFAESRGAVPNATHPPWPSSDDDDTADALYLGWEVARSAPGLSSDEACAVMSLAAACLVAMRAGSTRVPVGVERLGDVLASVRAGHLSEVATDLLARGRAGRPDDPVSRVLGQPGRRTPLIVADSWLCTERLFRLESDFCERVRRLWARTTPAPDSPRLAFALHAAAAGPIPLTDEQRAAVSTALSLPITLVTGGPGTGKTAVIAALLRALRAESSMDVALAAPTGKAALRMREALDTQAIGSRDAEPMTLHRLLGWSPTREKFARGERDRLPYGLVVIDEASMIDLVVMDRVLRALRSDARLVMLGDPNQLPSVDAGAVFRDLCAVLPTARLTVNLRVAREPSAHALVAVAESVRAGALDARFVEAVAVRRTPSQVAFDGVEHLSEAWAKVGEAVLDRWWSARLRAMQDFEGRILRVYRAHHGEFDEESVAALSLLFKHYGRSRLLCATRSRRLSTGAEALNDGLILRLRRATGRTRVAHGRELPPGTPVLTDRNDYERDLWNGDQGIVLWTDAGQGPMLEAVFPRGETFFRYPLAELATLTPAFAVTVHKAQGSEFDHVAVVLPEPTSPLSTRELLYTAITRARRSVLLVGEHERLAHAVSTSVARDSGVAERLATGGLKGWEPNARESLKR